MLELLSPAGSMEALRAAVQNGANAVYLGYDLFNARMGAQNFSADELQEAIVYCHVRGVQVHLTLNTLVSDREMARAAEVIRAAAVFGVDAFIVQDLGMVQLCKEIAPSVPMHASTQMSIHSLEGVVAAAELGCSRVVLSRELPMEQIRHICRRSPVEIEVFVHGALCMCYSGQCYLSSVIGRRSGNRGQCAQPCRLAYGYGRFEATRYPLSLKDNCLIEHVRELERMGVASVKIEGRMKRPEYVAVVTKAYRAAIDGRRVTENDMQQLEAVFSRQGFTQGYYEGKTGQSMFGTRQEPEDNRELFSAARATYESGETPARAGQVLRDGACRRAGAACRAGRGRARLQGGRPRSRAGAGAFADSGRSGIKAQENGRHAVLLRDGALGGGPRADAPGVGNQRDAARGARRADRAARQSGASKDERLQSSPRSMTACPASRS